MMSVNLARPRVFSLFAAILLVMPLALCTGGPVFAYSIADQYLVNDSVTYAMLEGNRMYAPAMSDGFYIFDISDPTDIQVLGHYEALGACLAKSIVRDGYAFINDWNYGLRVLDVHDPANITEVSSWEYTGNPGRAEGQALKDNYFYYTPWGAEKTQILDISDFDNIQPVGNFSVRDHSMESGAVMTTRIYGDVMYASLGYGGFHSIDVSNPVAPVYLDGVYHPAKADDHTFTVRDGYAYLGSGDYGFFIIDVSEPANMYDVFDHVWIEGDTLCGRYTITLGTQFDDGLQYLFTWSGAPEHKLHVWDVTDPLNPVEDAAYPIPTNYDIGQRTTYYDGGYLVSGSRIGKRVFTFDVTGYHVPEPSTLLIAATGALSLITVLCRRRKLTRLSAIHGDSRHRRPHPNHDQGGVE